MFHLCLTERAPGLTERAVAVGARLAPLVRADVDEEGDDAGQHDQGHHAEQHVVPLDAVSHRQLPAVRQTHAWGKTAGMCE